MPLEIPFSYSGHDNIRIHATINGTTRNFMFDTGMTFSLIDKTPVDNLKPVQIATVYYPLLDESHMSLFYEVNGIRFNDTVQLDTAISFVNADGVIGWGNILGINVFAGYWMELSFSRKKIILHKEKPGYFTKPLPAMLAGGQVLLFVEADGDRFYAAVDTGSREVLFPSAVLGRQRTPDGWSQVLADSANQGIYIVKPGSLKFIDEIFQDKYVLTNSPGILGYALFGLDILQYYDWLFDLREFATAPNQKDYTVYYEPIAPKEERDYGLYGIIDRLATSGIIRAANTQDSIYIEMLAKNSFLHEEFGIGSGTYITQINGIPVQELLRTLSFEELLNPEDPEAISSITIRKDGLDKGIVIPRR
jgi:hypothetical protein